MSASPALRTRPAVRYEATQAQHTTPRFRVIEGNEGRRRTLPMLVIGIIVVIVAITLPMLLNTHMAQTAHEIRAIQIKLNEEEAKAWTMQTELREIESAASLEKKAKELGMVPANVSGTITLSTGVVEGGTASR